MRHACSLDDLRVGRVYRLVRDGGDHETTAVFGGYDHSTVVLQSMRNSAIWRTGDSFTYHPYGLIPGSQKPHHVVNYWSDGEWVGWDHADRWFSSLRPRSWIELVESTDVLAANGDPLAAADRRRDDLLRKIFS